MHVHVGESSRHIPVQKCHDVEGKKDGHQLEVDLPDELLVANIRVLLNRTQTALTRVTVLQCTNSGTFVEF